MKNPIDWSVLSPYEAWNVRGGHERHARKVFEEAKRFKVSAVLFRGITEIDRVEFPPLTPLERQAKNPPTRYHGAQGEITFVPGDEVIHVFKGAKILGEYRTFGEALAAMEAAGYIQNPQGRRARRNQPEGGFIL